MRSATLLPLLVGSAAASSGRNHGGESQRVYKREQFERALSGSGDIDFDDDFWAYDQGSMDVVWDDYSIEPKKCMI